MDKRNLIPDLTFQRLRGWGKRGDMVGQAVEREIKKQYPTGLASDEAGMLIREKKKKEILKKLLSKNPKLLSY